MLIKVDERDLLDVLGEHGEHWLKGGWELYDRMCLHAAIRRCTPRRGDAFLLEQVARTKGWGTDWNDDEDTTWGLVRHRLANVEATAADLADTFGPQWPQIVDLVRAAASLTDQHRTALEDTSVDTHAASMRAWLAAQSCGREAADSAAFDAAWDAVATRYRDSAARYAAAYAARALVVRDVIGSYKFTQSHYDTLTAPWRRVIGPVHPDDPPLGAS